MKVFSLSDLDKLTLTALMGTTPPVALIGSGISLWAPSNLPTGNQFAKSVFSLLFHDELGNIGDQNPIILKKYFDKLPFEVINENCPSLSGIENLLRNIYDKYQPNPLHELFASLLCEGEIQSIITPNYDCCFDSAIARVFGSPISGDHGKVIRVINKDDSLLAQNHYASVYFKIHGSTDDESGESLVFHLNQEGVLQPWKRELFRNILRNKTLLVVGYSGSDFDICPEIALAKPQQIIWNFLSFDEKTTSPNIKFLSEQCDLSVIKGDMREFLSRLYRPVTASIGKSELDLDRLLMETFDDECRILWRIRIYNSINYNKSALVETNTQINQEHDQITLITFLSEHAGASASFGKYREAAKAHDKAARIAQDKSIPESILITQTLLACDAWRCYGSFLKSINRYRKAAFLIRDMPCPSQNLLADLDRNLILLIRHPYDFFRRFQMTRLTRKIQMTAAEAISRSVNFYRENGAWYQLQQVGLWRERFHLHEQISFHLDEYETPLSKEGYRQLNFPMGRMMAFRHEVKRIDRPLTTDEVNEARELISDAKELGITPEIWKLSMLILLKGKNGQRSSKDIIEFIKAFTSCQYSPLFRIWRLLLGE